MHTVLLYYKLTTIANPAKEVLFHKEVCTALGLTGRILIGDYGINGTVSGTPESIRLYRVYMDAHRLFKHIDFKESTSTIVPFPKLTIRVRDEIITTGAKEMITGCRRARHVDRDTFHSWLVNKDDIVLLDMRNDYEWEIGRFVNSVRPPMKYFRDLKDHIGFYEQFKGKKIVMFCTGGIRCEPASAYFIAYGFDPKNIYQLEGGIVEYAEKYGNSGFYEGKCFVFDERMALPVNTSETAVIVGHCVHCKNFSDIYRNCAYKQCNQLFIACDRCNESLHNTCSFQCMETINDATQMRPPHANDMRVLHRNK